MDRSGTEETTSDPTSPSKKPTLRDWAIAGTTGLFLVFVAFLGADKPPPPGFLAVIMMAAGLTTIIAFAMPRWRATKALPQCGKLRSPAVQGAVVGLALWGIALLLPFAGEPTVTPGFIDYAIAAALASSLGAAGAAILSRLA